jgi:hypothetical protein
MATGAGMEAHHGHRVSHRVVQLPGKGLAFARRGKPDRRAASTPEPVDDRCSAAGTRLPTSSDASQRHGRDCPNKHDPEVVTLIGVVR